jgi:nitrogen fixation/metabolism regulation signal transduction histidine kinase
MEHRKKIWVDTSTQLRYIINLSLVASLEMLVAALAVFFFILAMVEISPEGHWILFSRVLLLLAFVLLVGNIFNVFWGMYRSHRIVGPVQRLRRALVEIGEGRFEGVVRFRHNDELQALKEELNRTLENLRQRSKRVEEGKTIIHERFVTTLKQYEAKMDPGLKQALSEIEEVLRQWTGR